MSDIEARLSAIERRLGLVEELRTATDGDLSSLTQTVRAQHHLVQALAITQAEHTQVLERHTQSLARVEAGVQQIIEMLGRLEGR